MYTTDQLFREASPSWRALVAQRWGLGTTTEPMMVALLRTPRVAHRAYRRLNELGVFTLLRFLVEHAGRPFPVPGPLVEEAAELRRWLLLCEDERGVSLPADLAIALYRPALDAERFFAATLLSRLRREELDEVLAAHGVPRIGSTVTRVLRGAEALAAGEVPTGDDELSACARAEDLQLIDGARIESVTLVEGSRGRRYRVTCSDGETFDVAPRELAERAGYAFELPTIDEDVQLQPDEGTMRIRVPDHDASGALLRFSTSRAADDALRLTNFASVVARRLTDTVMLTRANVSHEEALALLEREGFAIEEPIERSRRERHASN